MMGPARVGRDVVAAAAKAAEPIPVLWLYGPPGVGKTTVGWDIYSQLVHAGIEAAYVDIDQLGMCYPETPADPGRHLLMARNLGAMVANFAAAGARSVIVSGAVDPARGVCADLDPHAVLITCRLRAGSAELRRRYLGRSGDAEAADDALREAATLDASDDGGVCIDTSGRSVGDIAADIVRRCGGWPALIGADGSPAPFASAAEAVPVESLGNTATGSSVPVLFLCGATGVGKSTVGFEIYMRDLRAGRSAADVDLDQIGFCSPAPAADPANHAVKARNLAALWSNFEGAGAAHLIVVGPAESERAARTYAAALPEAAITLCRLHAGPRELTRRIMSRGQGNGSWPQPGDPLVGQSPACLHRIAERAACDAAELERAGVGILRIDTGKRTAAAAADLAAAQTGWPG
jgi:adenylylsulfate kinase-like enzyme